MQFLPPHIADNEIIIALIFIFAIVDIVAWRKNGVLMNEFQKLSELSQPRSFKKNSGGIRVTKFFLYTQYCLFFGLSLFLLVETNPAESLRGLYEMNNDVIQLIGLCALAPLFWFLFHLAMFHWFDYIVGGQEKLAIIDRVYFAHHLLSSPLIMLLFIFFILANISTFNVAILLCAYFIITQILLIYSIFSVFSTNKSSTLYILLYLCALEIAPLAVIYAKFCM